MSEDGHDWIWTTEAAAELRLMPGDLRNVADALGVELRRHPTDSRRRVIHRDDVAVIAAAMEAARRNPEGRAA